MKEDVKFFMCRCGCKVIAVSKLEWDIHTTDVSMLIYGLYNPLVMDRLRHIWHIIRYGYPQGLTEILLPPSEAERLGNLILAIAEGPIDTTSDPVLDSDTKE